MGFRHILFLTSPLFSGTLNPLTGWLIHSYGNGQVSGGFLGYVSGSVTLGQAHRSPCSSHWEAVEFLSSSWSWTFHLRRKARLPIFSFQSLLNKISFCWRWWQPGTKYFIFILTRSKHIANNICLSLHKAAHWILWLRKIIIYQDTELLSVVFI